MKVSKERIARDLRNLGITEGSAVEVHSSLSSIGHVAGGASTVVDALIEAVGSTGTLVMSNYPLSRPLPVSAEEKAHGISWKLRRLPEDSTERTSTGAISDDFRSRPDVVCGSGIHRVCARGQNAEIHATGYEYLAKIDGMVLLIGVDIDRCSSMHLSESVAVTEHARDKMHALWGKGRSVPIPERIKEKYPTDIILGSEETGTEGDPWSNARDEAYKRRLIKTGKIGNAPSMFFKLNDVLRLLKKIRQHGPFLIDRDLSDQPI